jgi:hypothetical protein
MKVLKTIITSEMVSSRGNTGWRIASFAAARAITPVRVVYKTATKAATTRKNPPKIHPLSTSNSFARA